LAPSQFNSVTFDAIDDGLEGDVKMNDGVHRSLALQRNRLKK
jgi:hypothetical protein